MSRLRDPFLIADGEDTAEDAAPPSKRRKTKPSGRGAPTADKKASKGPRNPQSVPGGSSTPTKRFVASTKRPAGAKDRKPRRIAGAPESAGDEPAADDEADSGAEQTDVPARRPKRSRARDAPVEMSSKQPVSRFRQVVAPVRAKARDPRFDDAAGAYREAGFKQAYSWLAEKKQDELAELKAAAAKTKDPEKRSELRAAIARYRTESRQRSRVEREKGLVADWKKQERERVKAGKKPFFLKKADQKKLALADRFLELERSGQLDKFLEKKRKRNAAKDHVKMPRPAHS